MRFRLPPSPTPSTRIALGIGVAAALLVMVQVDPAGDYPSAPQGPGLTIDESFNVQEGVRLALAGKYWLLGGLSWRDVFGEREDIGNDPPAGYHLPDHPPLGRLWLGLVHQAVTTFVPPRDHPGPFVTAAARCGSALAFGATVFLVGWLAGRWYGTIGAAAAAAGLVMMPRVFGHAHLASLETVIGLAYAGAVIAVAVRWTGDAPRTRTALWTGAVFGLALLTKIQAVLIPPPVIVWALWRWKLGAIRPLAAWGLAGLATFFVLWPWLWLDPVGHFQQYLGRTTGRVSLGVWYLGERFADRDVPWHYPWVMFLVTVPVGLLLLGFLGAARSWRSPAERAAGERLIVGCLVFPLALFSLPGIAVYDGARLFLVSFPLWAVFVGSGAAALWERWCSAARSPARRRAAVAALTVLFLAQGVGLVRTAPAWLSYYNALVGGLGSAGRLGFERNYWGDAVTRALLEELAAAVPSGATVSVAPVLHQFQLDEMRQQSPVLRRRGLILRPWSADDPAEYVLIFDRLADLPDLLRNEPAGMTVVAEVRREGVRLAAVFARTGSSLAPSPGSRSSPD